MKFYRKRYVPNEIVDISNDNIKKSTKYSLITSWVPIKPREDFDRGISYYDISNGWKISKVYLGEKFIYYYCDIINTSKVCKDEYIFTDLLVDIVIYPDARIKILDMDELIEAYENNIIDKKTLHEAIFKLENLIKNITNKGIEKIVKEIEQL